MNRKATSKRDNPKMTFIGGLFGLVLAYAFLSRAIDTGSYWQYLGTVVFLILGIRLLQRIKK